MAEQVERVKTISDNGAVTETTRTSRVDTGVETQPVATETRPAAAEPASFTLARLIWLITGFIIALLALRFLFVLLGANASNGFVSLIYNLSYPFAAPFFGIFAERTQYGIARFELSTLIAMLVYALIAAGLARLATIRHPQAP